jgi:uncharacterized protein YwqG
LSIGTNDIKDCIKFQLVKSENIGLTDSKVGGIGYIDRDGNFPTNKKGQQMRLLAQINCGDLSAIEEIRAIDRLGLPDHGLLQFWILNDECIGMSLESNEDRDSYSVIYIENPDVTVTEDDIIEKFNPFFDSDTGYDYFPVQGEYKMQFELGKSTNIETVGSAEDYFSSAFDNEFEHKIGGYSIMCKDDTFTENELEKYDMLLLQLNSDFSDSVPKVMFSADGAGYFRISTNDLKARKFDKAIYAWDCY